MARRQQGVLKVMLRQLKLHLQVREAALRRLKSACEGRLCALVDANLFAGKKRSILRALRASAVFSTFLFQIATSSVIPIKIR